MQSAILVELTAKLITDTVTVAVTEGARRRITFMLNANETSPRNEPAKDASEARPRKMMLAMRIYTL